ncbi:MAG: hypothetical protein AAGG44_08015, partial [Planctomycetota bacterium]
MKAEQSSGLRISPSHTANSVRRANPLPTFPVLPLRGQVRLAHGLVALLAMKLLLVTSPLPAFDAPQDSQVQLPTLPRLSISGPRYQLLQIEIRYYDQGQITKTEFRRAEIGIDADVELEFGHEAFQVVAMVLTPEPIVLTLFDGETKLAERSTKNRGVASVAFGQVPETKPELLPIVNLSESSKQIARRFIEAIQQPSPSAIRSLVQASGARNIEWQTLASFIDSLRNELGEPTLSDETSSSQTGLSLFDRWLQWDGELGAVMLDGPIEFERGTCYFTLAAVDGQLADVQFRSSELERSEQWLSEPSSHAEYAAAAEKLLTYLFQFGESQSA